MNWKKDLAQAITDPFELLNILELNSNQMDCGDAQDLFALRVPRPYVSRIKKGDPNDPLLKQIWPDDKEYIKDPNYVVDPLYERQQNPAPGLLHKYGHRALAITTASCAVNCRYCFRRHFPYSEQEYGDDAWRNWVIYLNQHPSINELILSGGEPLLLSDKKLAMLDEQLQQSTQVKRIRIHSRMPLVIPSRITDALCSLISQSPMRYVMVWHINHPNEIDDNVHVAALKLHRAGLLQLNQSVLLAGVNDSAAVLESLSEALFDCRIQPYYLHLLDKVDGTKHFETSEQKAKLIHKNLLAQLPGFLVPKLVREDPFEKSKTPILSGLNQQYLHLR